MARYTDEFRAQALLILEANGWPDRRGAIISTAKTLGINHQTLSHWARRHASQSENEVSPKLLREKTFDLKQALRDEIQAILEEFHHARPDADYKELGTVLGIVIDKLQLIGGKATERVAYLTEQERTDRITELLETARNRRDGHVTDIVQ